MNEFISEAKRLIERADLFQEEKGIEDEEFANGIWDLSYWLSRLIDEYSDEVDKAELIYNILGLFKDTLGRRKEDGKIDK